MISQPDSTLTLTIPYLELEFLYSAIYAMVEPNLFFDIVDVNVSTTSQMKV